MRKYGAVIFAGIFLALIVGAIYWGADYKLIGTRSGGVSVKVYGPDQSPQGDSLAAEDLGQTSQALAQLEKHLTRADLFIDVARNPRRFEGPDQPRSRAEFIVSLELNTGIKLESKRQRSSWKMLDQEMARAVEKTMDNYYRLREQHGLRGRIRKIYNL